MQSTVKSIHNAWLVVPGLEFGDLGRGLASGYSPRHLPQLLPPVPACRFLGDCHLPLYWPICPCKSTTPTRLLLEGSGKGQRCPQP